MTLSDLSFVVFLDPYQGSDGICLLSRYVVFVVQSIMTLSSLSSYSNKAFISGAHRWKIKYTYLQDIYCIVKPWIQSNKSISLIKMCMCGEWMVYGDDGDNNGRNNGGGSLILLLLFEGIHTFLAFWIVRRMRCSIFFSFLSSGYLVPLILLSDTCPCLTFSFLRGSEHLLLFISSYYFPFFFQSIHLLR